ncbi:MAG: BamA/TamA family outer membrane protein [Burkholderiales bacterium]
MAGGSVFAQNQPAPDALPAAASTPSDDDQGAVSWTLQVQAPGDLRELLERHLDLARYADQADRDSKTPDKGADSLRIGRGELQRLVAATPAQARALLETEGYFAAQVQARLEPDAAPGARLQVQVDVQPGPRTRVSAVHIDFAGSLSQRADGGDADAQALAARLQRGFAAKPGEPFTQAAWSGAKTALINSLRAQGYGLANYSGTHAQVDAEAQQATLVLVLDSGPLLRIGATRIEGLRHVAPLSVAALQPYAQGEPMREQALQTYQDRLIKTGLFDTISVAMAPEVLADPAQLDSGAAELTLPVLVRLHERSQQQATVGLGVSDVTGPRITLEHLHQSPFGLDWQAKSKVQIGQTERSVSLDLVSHPRPGPYRDLISGALTRTEATGLVVLSQTARVGRSHDTEAVERLYFLQFERDVTRAESAGAVTDDTSALTLNHHWVWRRLDNLILPTRGFGASAEVGGGRSFHTDTDSGFFGRTSARITGYWPFGSSWYGQARLQAGQVFAAPTVDVPYTQLFRAGGDDSVRGYGNQGLGPVNAAGTAIGGHVLGTASIEVARPISRKQPAFWLAAFVDAGNAAVNWRAFEPVVGYGVGLRWRSPVGPLRIDLAWAERDRRARLHFNVGITF